MGSCDLDMELIASISVEERISGEVRHTEIIRSITAKGDESEADVARTTRPTGSGAVHGDDGMCPSILSPLDDRQGETVIDGNVEIDRFA